MVAQLLLFIWLIIPDLKNLLDETWHLPSQVSKKYAMLRLKDALKNVQLIIKSQDKHFRLNLSAMLALKNTPHITRHKCQEAKMV